MAFTSFTIRNTVTNGGSALRRTNVNQDSSDPTGSGIAVSDSALRADGYFVPVPSEFLESTFSANVYNRTEIELEWEFGFSLVNPVGGLTEDPKPVEVLIRASNYGEPITAGDGVFVTSVTYSDFKLRYTDKNSLYIKDGNWVYYSMFIKYEDNAGGAFYERVAILSIQIPRNFNSTEDLWSRIPAYYKGLDEQQDELSVTGYTPLYGFVDLFGWELDKIRTTIYDTMRINDPEVVHSSAIDALANQSGIEFTKDALGTSKLRAILNNIGYLRRTKGTIGSIEAYISALSGCGVTTTLNLGVTEFNVHPMRVNLVTDPFFNQSSTGPSSPDTGATQRKWAAYSAGSRVHGWGVYAVFSADPATDMSVSTSGDKLTVTLPALSGTVSLLIYSRGLFAYNNNLTYYFSANTSHSYKPRFLLGTTISGFEATSPPASFSYFDDWNDAVTSFPQFKDFLTNDSRKIFSSIPKTTSVADYPVVPVFKFDITLSSSQPTVLTFEKPMVEYRNSSGAFFSGNEPLGGFIQDPTSSMGAGSYDYHWGVNAASVQHTDFSYYTIDFQRVKSVVDNVIENYIVPVNIVKNTDYVINWDVLE